MQKRHFLARRDLACAVLLALGSSFACAQQTSTYQFQYDAIGNLTQITDPLGQVTNQSWDALNRLTQRVQPAPASGMARPTISYTYDGLDQLIGVTDPRQLATTYTIDGLGNQTARSSPDTGTTSKTYDEAGNFKTSTDAKGQVATYQYDALNRVAGISYSDGSVITYTYDQGTNGIGRLTGIADSSGTIQYSYDQHGRLLNEVHTISGVAYTTSYGYDNAGRLATMSYPSGRQLTYQRDAMGRIVQIDASKNGVTQTVVSQVTYQPFGGVASFVNGANQTVSRTSDLDGRTNGYTLGVHAYSVGYDAASRINTIAEPANPVNAQIYGYDGLDRLVSYSGTGASQSFTYDATGNRSGKVVGAAATSYLTAPTSNRLNQTTGNQTVGYQTDLNGSIFDNGNAQFNYDVRGRMISASTVLGQVLYGVNALGQRVTKTVQGTTTVFHYGAGGKLISESAAQGATWKDYIYLDDLPVALFQ